MQVVGTRYSVYIFEFFSLKLDIYYMEIQATQAILAYVLKDKKVRTSEIILNNFYHLF